MSRLNHQSSPSQLLPRCWRRATCGPGKLRQRLLSEYMHGQGYRGNNTDPTSPSYLGSLPQGVGTSYGRGAAIGRTEHEAPSQRPFPPVPQNGGNQFPGFPSNIPKVLCIQEAFCGIHVRRPRLVCSEYSELSVRRLWCLSNLCCTKSKCAGNVGLDSYKVIKIMIELEKRRMSSP